MFILHLLLAVFTFSLKLSSFVLFYLSSCSHFFKKTQLFRERLPNRKALKRTRQYRKAWWVVVVHCCIVKFTSFQRDGRRCYEYLFACVKRSKIASELLTCLLKFIEYFPEYLSALSRTLVRFFGQPLSKQLLTRSPRWPFPMNWIQNHSNSFSDQSVPSCDSFSRIPSKWCILIDFTKYLTCLGGDKQ